jgi:hypothetical protein
MPIFQLREKCALDLGGDMTYIDHHLERQTEKAVLLAVIHRSRAGERKVCYWFPKSVVIIDGKKVFGEIDLKAAKKIECPDWLWEKRKVAP